MSREAQGWLSLRLVIQDEASVVSSVKQFGQAAPEKAASSNTKGKKKAALSEQAHFERARH